MIYINSYFFTLLAALRQYQWTRTIDSAGADRGTGITCDSTGNVYVTGLYTGTPDVDDESANRLMTLPASTGIGVFLAKFDNSGNFKWARVVDSAGQDEGNGVACDSSGNVYIAGFYSGTPTIKFENGTGSNTLPASASNAAFLSKFDTNGVYQWSRILDSAGADQGRGVACDSSGNVYFVGWYTGTPTIRFENGNGSNTLPASTSSAAFISKFSSSGVYLWSRVVDSAGADQGRGVACDSSGNVYLAGVYAGTPTIKFENGAGSNTLSASTSTAAFLSKFNTNGVYQWSRTVDATGADEGWGVTSDSSGNVYLAGVYIGTPTIKFENGNGSNTLPASASSAAFLSKFDTNGVYQWSRVVDASGFEYGLGVTTDSIQNVYFAGYYTGTPTIKFENGTGSNTLPTSTVDAAFVSKFSSSGVYQWSRVIDSAGIDYGWGVTSDSSGNVYLSGSYTGTPRILTQAGISYGTIPTSTGVAGFITKFDENGEYATNSASHMWSRIVDAGSTSVDRVLGVACDINKNMYMSGYYIGTPTIKDENNTSLGTLPVNVGSDVAFVSKFSSSGVYMWSRVIDSAGADQAHGVTCDSSGNVYIAGFYTGTPTIKFENGAGSNTLPASSGTSSAAFISKFDTNGVYQWARILDAAGGDRGRGVACDSSGNVYFAGFYNGTPTIKFENGAGSNTLPASTGAAFVSKFSSSGVYLWSRIINATSQTSNEGANGVACDSSGNVYIAGFYRGTPTIQFENGNGSNTLPTAVLSAVFLSKFDTNGVYQWSRVLDAASNDECRGVACDSSGNVYITGFYFGTPTIKFENGAGSNTLPNSSGGSSAVFLSKFDTNGVYQWSRVLDSASNDEGRGVACDSVGNVYLTGYYQGLATIKTQTNETISTIVAPIGGTASVLSMFTTNGTYLCSRIVDSSGGEDSFGCVCDLDGNMYLGGFYTGTPTIRNEIGSSFGILPATVGGTSAFTTKFSTFFSNTAVYEYPPTRLTANSFTVTGQSYGNGLYILAASSESTAATGPFQAFDKSVSNVYQSAASRYSTTTPFASTGVATTVVSGFGTLSGEWIDITLPNSTQLQLYGYQIQPTATIAAGPGTFFLCGFDGTNFVLVDRRSGYTWTSQSAVTFQTNIQSSYSRYRLIVINLAGNAGNLQIAELRFFGT